MYKLVFSGRLKLQRLRHFAWRSITDCSWSTALHCLAHKRNHPMVPWDASLPTL